MEITYIGQSAFRLRGKEVTVVTNPPEGSKVTADVVTYSQLHGANGSGRVIEGPGEYEVAGVLIGGVATQSEPGSGPVNTAYVMRLDDLVVCHLGRLAGTLSDKQVEELGAVDVLLVPVGGDGTVGPAEASQVVTQVEPKIVVPMHFGADRAAAEADVAQFCREMGSKDVAPESKLVVSRGSLPSEVRVTVLEQKGV